MNKFLSVFVISTLISSIVSFAIINSADKEVTNVDLGDIKFMERQCPEIEFVRPRKIDFVQSKKVTKTSFNDGKLAIVTVATLHCGNGVTVTREMSYEVK